MVPRGLAVLCASILLVPLAVGHAAPDPPEWMTRILHDYCDDWGTDGANASPRDGHDLIALDLREEYNATFKQDTLVLRLAMNYGWDTDGSRPELKEVITFKANGQTVTREFKTLDNKQFTGNFDAVYGPQPILKSDGSKDGGRFYVEGLLKFGTLGLKVGDKVGGFEVQGYGGSAKADTMLGGYYLNGQYIDTRPPCEDTSYRRNEYPLKGPVMYVRSSVDKTAVTAKPGENRTITWSITNTLGKTQAFQIEANAPSGVTVGLHSGRYTEDTLSLSVPPGVTATVHAYVLPKTGAASGDLDLILTTSLGGRTLHQVDVTVPGATVTEQNSETPAASTPEGSPGLAGVAVLSVLVSLALVLRRRGR